MDRMTKLERKVDVIARVAKEGRPDVEFQLAAIDDAILAKLDARIGGR